MKEKTINPKWQKLKYFRAGVGVGFLLLGLTISTGAKNIPETPTPPEPTKLSQGQSSPAPEIQLKIEGEVRVSEPLILENPNIKVEACLCERVDDRMPVNRFEEETPRIPVDIGTIWCFARVFGRPGYEKGKKTEITYLWYYNGKLVHSYTQEVGFNLAPRGWRTYAFKNLHGRIGTWKLEIAAKHKRLASLSFETY